MAESTKGASESFQAVNALGSGYVQSAALRAQADYEKKLGALNNKTLEAQIKDTEARGREAEQKGLGVASKREQGIRKSIGSQRAILAAQGVDPGSAEVIAQTEAIGAADILAAKSNAFAEAFGYKSKANALRGAQVSNTLDATSKANALRYASRSSMITGWTEFTKHGFEAASAVAPKGPGAGGK